LPSGGELAVRGEFPAASASPAGSELYQHSGTRRPAGSDSILGRFRWMGERRCLPSPEPVEAPGRRDPAPLIASLMCY
jgi:hypothetical protein